MPSVSQNQQIATAIAKTDPGSLYPRNKGLLGMSKGQLGDFASTPRQGLPKRVGDLLSGKSKPRKGK